MKPRLKRARPDLLSAKGETSVRHVAHAVERQVESSDETKEYALSLNTINQSVNEISRGAKKLFANLPVSVRGDVFTDVVVQVDSAATCNTMPYEMYCKLGAGHKLRRSPSVLHNAA